MDNRYAYFKAGKERFLGHDLFAGRYFVVNEGRYAFYDNNQLVFDNGDRIKAYKVWQGPWPARFVGKSEKIFMNHIENKRDENKQH